MQLTVPVTISISRWRQNIPGQKESSFLRKQTDEKQNTSAAKQNCYPKRREADSSLCLNQFFLQEHKALPLAQSHSMLVPR